MKYFKWLLLLILLILLFSCSGSKSIEGTKWVKGWIGHDDKSGNFIPQCKEKRYRGFTKG